MKRFTLIAAATVLTVGLAAPAASADVVDNYLAKIPSGQITCEQAQKYYTDSSDYNAKKQQALAVATVHPRGAEIRDAIARADEAIARCNLNGGGTTPAQNQGQTPSQQTPSQQTPAATKQVIPLFTQSSTATTDIEVPGTNYVVRVPDLQSGIAQFNSLSSR